jgi:hypothetical protein
MATSGLRALPDFLILGAAKCGTTSLYVDLRAHPEVRRALRKEVWFFDQTYHRGESWYRSFFPLRSSLGGADGRDRAVTGEATPCYLFHPLAPARVAETTPDAKLIVQLRDPVARAHSYYHQVRRFGLEWLGFEEAIDEEPERLAGEEERILRDPTYFSFNRQYYSYLARGRYAEQLEGWLERFPRERILVLFAEELWANPREGFRAVTDFLGIGRWQPPAPAHRKRSDHRPMAPGTRRRLEESFRPHDERLSDLLGRHLPWRK